MADQLWVGPKLGALFVIQVSPEFVEVQIPLPTIINRFPSAEAATRPQGALLEIHVIPESVEVKTPGPPIAINLLPSDEDANQPQYEKALLGALVCIQVLPEFVEVKKPTAIYSAINRRYQFDSIRRRGKVPKGIGHIVRCPSHSRIGRSKNRARIICRHQLCAVC